MALNRTIASTLNLTCLIRFFSEYKKVFHNNDNQTSLKKCLSKMLGTPQICRKPSMSLSGLATLSHMPLYGPSLCRHTQLSRNHVTVALTIWEGAWELPISNEQCALEHTLIAHPDCEPQDVSRVVSNFGMGSNIPALSQKGVQVPYLRLSFLGELAVGDRWTSLHS